MHISNFFKSIPVLLVILGGLFLLKDSPDIVIDAPLLIKSAVEDRVRPLTIVMAGDVMLGRHVRTLMENRGQMYPFAHASTIFGGADAVVANLEGPITERRVESAHGMQFSFATTTAPLLADAGFTHLSLANNHVLDQGTAGHEDTRRALRGSGITFFGDRTGEPLGGVVHETKNGHDIVFVGLDATLAPLNLSSVSEALGSYPKSAVVFVFIHWGEEYEPVHNTNQEQIAHALIDAGADAIIGSHPHVVQDIGVYQGVPIFYSLGNFIFDQYWNSEVETGLALRTKITKSTISYQLVPIHGNHSSPIGMEGEGRASVLDTLATKSPAPLAEAIRSAELTFPRPTE